MGTPPASSPPTAAPFSCVTSTKGRQVTAVLHGDLDLANSPLLRNELLATLENGTAQLSLDLSNLTFIDSSGIAALVVVHKRATDRGGRLQLEAVPPQVHRVLRACGVDEIFGL